MVGQAKGLNAAGRGAVEHSQEFLACGCVFTENTQHGAGYHRHTGAVHATGGHAFMGRFNEYGNTLGLQNIINGVGNLCGKPFLNLQAAGIGIDHAG